VIDAHYEAKTRRDVLGSHFDEAADVWRGAGTRCQYCRRTAEAKGLETHISPWTSSWAETRTDLTWHHISKWSVNDCVVDPSAYWPTELTQPFTGVREIIIEPEARAQRESGNKLTVLAKVLHSCDTGLISPDCLSDSYRGDHARS
jgi:hypothetical protein